MSVAALNVPAPPRSLSQQQQQQQLRKQPDNGPATAVASNGDSGAGIGGYTLYVRNNNDHEKRQDDHVVTEKETARERDADVVKVRDSREEFDHRGGRGKESAQKRGEEDEGTDKRGNTPSEHIYIYVCIFYIYIYIYIYIYTFVHRQCVSAHEFMRNVMCLVMYVCVCMHMCASARAHTNSYRPETLCV
jgi:hypothetical protein